MQKLTNKEEEIMQILWRLKKAFVKEVMAEIKEDQPHYNTLSTIIRNLEEKGFVSYNAFGNTHQYYPIVKMEDYRKRFMNTAIENYFDNSYKHGVFFCRRTKNICRRIKRNSSNNRTEISYGCTTNLLIEIKWFACNVLLGVYFVYAKGNFFYK